MRCLAAPSIFTRLDTPPRIASLASVVSARRHPRPSTLIAARTPPSARTLIDYSADPRFVNLDLLFRRADDPYSVVARYIKKQTKKKASLVLARSSSGIAPEQSVGEPSDADRLVDGFDVLATWGDILGYRTHLDANRTTARLAFESIKAGRRGSNVPRSPTSFTDRPDLLCASWTDLMLWAVMVSEPKLAWLLWRKTLGPMRAAIMASRLCQCIGDKLGEDSFQADEAHEQALLYEGWAIGVVDAIADHELCIELLTLVPKRMQPGSGGSSYIKMWENSVMDQACADKYPCKAFVAQTNPQLLLDNFYNGDYYSSRAAIPVTTKHWRLAVQIFVQFIHLLTLGLLVRVLPSFAVIETPWYAEEDPPDDEELADDDNDWDLDYFTASGAGTRRDPKRQPGPSSSDARDGLSSYARFWTQWAGFFAIPRVKFMVHTSVYLLYVVLYTLILPVWGSDGIWLWSQRLGTLYDMFPYDVTAGLVIELLLWSYLLGRILEEVYQAYTLKGSYFSDFWNFIDVATVTIMGTCFALRLIVWIDGGNASAYAADHAHGAVRSAYTGEGVLGLSTWTKLACMQLIQCCFCVSVTLVFFRFFDNLSIFP